MEYHHHLDPADDRLGKVLVDLEAQNFGYQIRSKPSVPFKKGEFSSMFVYAYRQGL
jgi:hypothetical protein